MTEIDLKNCSKTHQCGCALFLPYETIQPWMSLKHRGVDIHTLEEWSGKRRTGMRGRGEAQSGGGER